MLSTCQLGAGLVVASVLVSMLSTQGKKEFLHSLDPAQREQYNRIARSRLMIYLAALGAGGAAGWVTSGWGAGANEGGRGWAGVCSGVGVAAVVTYFVYRLWPKDQWMLNHVTTPQQTQLWLKMYRTMSTNFHAGFLVGILGYAVFLRGMCVGKTCSAPRSGDRN
eukprot:jgi/Tetstr1/454189/TSEL_041108.t1